MVEPRESLPHRGELPPLTPRHQGGRGGSPHHCLRRSQVGKGTVSSDYIEKKVVQLDMYIGLEGTSGAECSN